MFGNITRAEINIALDGETMSELRSPPTPKSFERHFLSSVFLAYLAHGSVDRVAFSSFSAFFFRLRYKAPHVTGSRKTKRSSFEPASSI